MAVFGQVRRDLKDRKNLDIYTSVGVALVASALSVFDILPPDKTTSAVMAILAVVAFNQLVTRSIAERAAESHGDVFRAQFSPDLVPKRASAESLYLAGVTMGRTIRESYGALEISLRRGAHVRILLTDPDADDAALDARCQISRPTPDEIKVEIRHALRKLTALRRSTEGKLEVPLTRSAMKFGMNYFNPGTARSEIHIQLYSYRLSGESRPMFSLSPQDGEWFDCYADQAEGLWKDAQAYDFDADADEAA